MILIVANNIRVTRTQKHVAVLVSERQDIESFLLFYPCQLCSCLLNVPGKKSILQKEPVGCQVNNGVYMSQSAQIDFASRIEIVAHLLLRFRHNAVADDADSEDHKDNTDDGNNQQHAHDHFDR